MKVLLIDYSNEGILYVGSSLAVVNQLKRGLVDTSIRLLWPWHDGYSELTQKDILDGRHVWINTSYKISDLSPSARNQIYLERQRLVGLRYRLMESLMLDIAHCSRTTKFTPWEGFENNLEIAMKDCDPTNSTWSPAVMQYSLICGIEPEFAYREIRIQLEHVQNLKIRLYAFMNYYGDRINQIVDEDGKIAVQESMQNTFVRDVFI